MLGNSLFVRRSSASIRTTPVVIHLSIQLFLGLARTSVDHPTAVTATAALSPTTARPRTRRPLSGDIPVDVVGRGLRHVAATVPSTTTSSAPTTATTSPPTGTTFAITTARAQAARIAGALNTVEQTAAGALDVVEGVAVSSAATGGHEGDADGLTLGVCAVELADGGAGVADAAVGDEGDALGAAGAVVNKG